MANKKKQVAVERRRRVLVFVYRNRGAHFGSVSVRGFNKHSVWRLSLVGYGLRFRGVASLFGGFAERTETPVAKRHDVALKQHARSALTITRDSRSRDVPDRIFFSLMHARSSC